VAPCGEATPSNIKHYLSEKHARLSVSLSNSKILNAGWRRILEKVFLTDLGQQILYFILMRNGDN